MSDLDECQETVQAAAALACGQNARCTGADDDDDRGDPHATATAASRRADLRVAVFVLCSYFVLSMCWAAPGTLLPFIASDLGLTSADCARLSATATVSSCLAKLSMGPVVDRVGGRRSALMSLTMVSVMLYLLGRAASAPAVGVAWFAVAWMNAPMWPAEAVVMKVCRVHAEMFITNVVIADAGCGVASLRHSATRI